MLHVLGQARPALRAVLAATAAHLLAPLAAHLLVDKAPAAAGQGAVGYRRLLRWLHQEVPLAFFPTSEQADFSATAARLLTTLPLPVVPIGLSSRPPAPEGWWERVPARLYQSDFLPSELLSQRGTTVRVCLGPAVLPTELHGVPVASRPPYLRARLAALLPGGAASCPAATPPAAATDYTLLEADLAALPPKRHLVRCRHWDVYVAKSHELPHVLPALNYLRECTLGQAGAARPTATEADLAPDCHRHLLLYDRRARRLVGACRLGLGKRLLRQRGRLGFGLHAACKLGRELGPLLRQSLEISQAFIRAEYQGQLLPLGLVWEGLAQYLKQRPHYRYLLGQVSFSHELLAMPKAELAGFIRQHCPAAEEAAFVRPRKLVRYRTPSEANAALDYLDQEEVMQALLTNSTPGGLGVSLRLRPYFRQQVRLLNVHLDPAGSGALCGAFLLDAATLGHYTYSLAERSAALPSASR